MRRPSVHPGFAAALAILALALPAFAADINVTLPVVSGIPGTVVNVPITATPGPSGLGIMSIDFRLAFNPAVVWSSSSQPDGFLQGWGTPFVNGTGSFLAAVAAGATPLTSGSTLLNTVQVMLRANAVVGTIMPLTFQHILFNEGTPTVAVTNGSIQVTAPPLDAPPPAARGLALALATASPVRGPARFVLSVPAGGTGRLAVFALDGRRVRTLAAAAAPGEHTLAWDLRSEQGRDVRAGVYFARADAGGTAVVTRFVVLE